MSDSKELERLLSEKWNQGLTWRAFLTFSRKNVERMNEWHQKTEIEPEIAGEVRSFQVEIRLLTLGADWCGDCVVLMPGMARLAELSPKIELRVLERDRHDDLMACFLTNGARAVPKVIAATADMSRHRTWGARPAAAQAIMTENKGKRPKEEILPLIRQWYEEDGNRTLLRELLSEIEALTKNG